MKTMQIKPTFIEKWVEWLFVKILARFFSKIFELSTEYNRSVLVIFAALSMFLVPGNVYNIVGNFYGGVVDNNVTNERDPVVQSMKFVKLFQKEGLGSNEALFFVLPLKDVEGGQKANLLALERIHGELEEHFAECGIFSLINFSNFRVETQGGYKTLYISSFADKELLDKIRKRESFNFEKWRTELEKKSGPKGLLYAADHSFLRVVVVLPEGYHEGEIGNRVASYLEQRRIEWYHWFVRKDIHPTGFYQDIKVVGWVIGRVLVHAALFFAVLACSSLGMGLGYYISWKTLRSWKQALIIFFSILTNLIWIRGTVGWMHFFHSHFGWFEFCGEPIKERVYILLVFTSLIIAGISYKIRPFEMYNDLRRSRPDLTPSQCWLKVRIDLLGKVSTIFLISFANFMTLYQIGNRGIMEVGILSATGLVQSLFLAFIVIPAAQVHFGVEANEKFVHYSQLKIWDWLKRNRLGLVSRASLAFLGWFMPKAKKFGEAFLILIQAVLFPVASFLRRVYLGWLVDLAEYFFRLGTSDGWNDWIDRRIAGFYHFLILRPPQKYPSLEKRPATKIFVLPVVRALARVLMPFTAVKAIAVTSILVLSAGSIVAVDYFFHQDREPEARWIVVNEDPIGYLPKTIFAEGCGIVNPEETGTAQGRLPFWVFPRDPKYIGQGHLFDENNPEHWEKLYEQVMQYDESGYDPVENPDFSKRVREFQDRIAQVKGARQVWSILNGLQDYSRELWGRDLPQNRQEVFEALNAFDNSLLESPNGDLVKSMSWFPRGICLSAFLPANSSWELRTYREKVMEIAKNEFPDLIVAANGKLHQYAQSDFYISPGKIKNIISSFYLVVLFCALWIKIRNWLSWRQRNSCTLSAFLTGLAMTIPFLFSFAIIIHVMAIFRIPLDQAMACATALGINAAIDFDVYFVADYHQALLNGVVKREELLRIALREKGRLIFIDMVVNAAVFAPLMWVTLAQFPPVIRLGQILVLMMFTCGIGALVIMPAVLSLCIVRTKKPVNLEFFPGTKKVLAEVEKSLPVYEILRLPAWILEVLSLAMFCFARICLEKFRNLGKTGLEELFRCYGSGGFFLRPKLA